MVRCVREPPTIRQPVADADLPGSRDAALEALELDRVRPALH
jgi:hypothetical protein